MFAFAMIMSLCVDVMVMSSAQVVSFTGTCGVGLSDVYMLKSVGVERRLVDHNFGIGVVFMFCF